MATNRNIRNARIQKVMRNRYILLKDVFPKTGLTSDYLVFCDEVAKNNEVIEIGGQLAISQETENKVLAKYILSGVPIERFERIEKLMELIFNRLDIKDSQPPQLPAPQFMDLRAYCERHNGKRFTKVQEKLIQKFGIDFKKYVAEFGVSPQGKTATFGKEPNFYWERDIHQFIRQIPGWKSLLDS